MFAGSLPRRLQQPVLGRAEARSFVWVSHVVAGAQSFELSSAAFRRLGAGAGLATEQLGHDPLSIWNVGIIDGIFIATLQCQPRELFFKKID